MPPPFTSYTQTAGLVKAADHPINYPPICFPRAETSYPLGDRLECCSPMSQDHGVWSTSCSWWEISVASAERWALPWSPVGDLAKQQCWCPDVSLVQAAQHSS